MRETFDSNKVEANALKKIETFHSDVVNEVKKAVSENKVVIVGMAQNPVVKKARSILDNKNVTYKYCEYGSYFSAWKPRLAIKLWSGWPTFPQVFINGTLIGGCDDLVAWLQKNSLN